MMELSIKGIKDSIVLKVIGFILLFMFGGAAADQVRYSFFNKTGGLTGVDEMRIKDHLQDNVMKHMTSTERTIIAVKEERLNNRLSKIQEDIGQIKTAINELTKAVNQIGN